MNLRRVVPTLFVAAGALLVVAQICPPGFAQQPTTVPDTKQVLGLEGVKHKAKGTLSVEKGTLEFETGKKKVELPVTSIDDVITGNDSQRAIGGFIGTISMFGPYGSGRFLSLFRTKIDTLTIQYHDASGGVHGAVFTLPEGKAEGVKKELVAAGAKTTIPIEPAATGQAPASPKKEEPKQ